MKNGRIIAAFLAGLLVAICMATVLGSRSNSWWAVTRTFRRWVTNRPATLIGSSLMRPPLLETQALPVAAFFAGLLAAAIARGKEKATTIAVGVGIMLFDACLLFIWSVKFTHTPFWHQWYSSYGWSYALAYQFHWSQAVDWFLCIVMGGAAGWVVVNLRGKVWRPCHSG